MFALIDGNSFFASCERVFRPDLWRKPVIVLSNNDGCVIARSEEAKKAGIPMGAPFFKISGLVERHGIAAFSCNYELYADLSARMMACVASLAPALEVYSIDEAFADFSGITDASALGVKIRHRVMRWIGIPACVGIGASKTLAKFSNHLAKRNPRFSGVCNWLDLTETERLQWMRSTSVFDLWGIGRKLGEKLLEQRIRTVFDLYGADPALMRRRHSVTVERIVHELHGIPCLELEEISPAQRQVLRSRSFAEEVSDIGEIKAAVSRHAHSAAAALRRWNGLASCVGVMIRTNRFKAERHFGWDVTSLPAPSSDTLVLSAAATRLAGRIFRPGMKYKKAGVVLLELVDANTRTGDLFNPGDSERSRALMQTIDSINSRYGGEAVKSAAELVGTKWHTRRERLSPRYTTRWDELRRVDAGTTNTGFKEPVSPRRPDFSPPRSESATRA
ncbi:MAG: Y-family DNA polymerase [Candidatus Accumulibacter sp.]|jgi:DNA polymerase V|nr:Y-family DNA polymerase [Accumulibacter sp.]